MAGEVADDFVLDQIDLNRDAVYGAVQRIADSRGDPPATFSDVLAQMGTRRTLRIGGSAGRVTDAVAGAVR